MPVLQAVFCKGICVGLRTPVKHVSFTYSLSRCVCVFNSHNSGSTQIRQPLLLPTNMNTTQPAADSHQSVTHACVQCTLRNKNTNAHAEGPRISQKHLMKRAFTVRQQDTGDPVVRCQLGNGFLSCLSLQQLQCLLLLQCFPFHPSLFSPLLSPPLFIVSLMACLLHHILLFFTFPTCSFSLSFYFSCVLYPLPIFILSKMWYFLLFWLPLALSLSLFLFLPCF